MPEGTPELLPFAYGEDLEEGTQRSLGYRLLAPAAPAPWCVEVEALARRLQTTPYPDPWPATDLFCSILLADGRRVVALARYGLVDHTPSHRRGGLEVVGVVAPGDLDVATALAIHAWLRQRRAQSEGVPDLSGMSLEAIRSSATPVQPEGTESSLEGQQRPVLVLPVRLWQDGVMLFAAASPSDPDRHLRLLELGAGPCWQWLGLVGPDFPLPSYAQRGPLVAWTPHLAGVALKLDPKAPLPAAASPTPPHRWRRGVLLGIGGVLALLLALNFWGMWRLQGQVHHLQGEIENIQPGPAPGPARSPDASRERFASALYQLLQEREGREWTAEQSALLGRYAELTLHRRDLRVRDGNTEGKMAVAVVDVLAGRTPERIEDSVRQALSGKGFDQRLIELATGHVRQQLKRDLRERK